LRLNWIWLVLPTLLIGCNRQQFGLLEPERSPKLRGAFSLGVDLRQHTSPRVGGDLDPALSPDGVHLGFSSRRDGPLHNLYQKNLRRSEVTRVTSFAAQDRFPEFSPDGRWLAFASNRDGNWDIWLAPALAGGPLRQLTTGLDDEIRPTWSPDGKRLAFSARNQHKLWTIWIWEKKRNRLISVGPGLFPSWSPTGDEIVFQKNHPTIKGWSTLWTYVFATGQGSQLYADPRYSALFPSWSSSGERIVFAVRPAGSDDWWEPQASALWIMDRRGEPPLLLHDSGEVLGAPVWAGDGRIYFPSQREGVYAIWSLKIRRDLRLVTAKTSKE